MREEEEILVFTVNSEKQIKYLRRQLKEQGIIAKALFLLSEEGIAIKLEKFYINENFEQAFNTISKKLDLSDLGK